MGFNIGVSSEHAEENIACDCFIDRAFYNFVNSAEMYGDKSILIQSGNYYGLDLSPLLKLVYTWDEVTQEYINENIQHTGFLLDLVSSFQSKIELDRSACNKINYVWYDSLVMITDEEIQQLIKEMGKEAAAPFLGSIEKQKKGN